MEFTVLIVYMFIANVAHTLSAVMPVPDTEVWLM